MSMENSRPVGVAVVGSANMDTVFTVGRMPGPGETLLAEQAANHAGGKGLNQAVASARAGSPTRFIGAVGTDAFGDKLIGVMDDTGVERSLLRRTADATGQAFILVDRAGENLIVVASGANAAVAALTEAEADAVAQASVLLMQLELPVTVVVEAARLAKAAGVLVILNAAPAAELPEGMLESVDCLVVNEHEACVLAGSDDVPTACEQLAARVDRLIVTLGSDGSAVYEGGALIGTVPPPAVTAVDTTGAGDTFCGAFAAATADGHGYLDAVRFATAAAALSVQAIGAVPSVPARSEIDEVLEGAW